MNNKNTMQLGKIALVAVGAYFVWKNRAKVQSFLESKGLIGQAATELLEDASQVANDKISSFENSAKSGRDMIHQMSS